MNRLIEWWRGCKDNSTKKKMAAFKDEYKVAEKNGVLYLTHQGFAFAKISPKASATEIAAWLDEAREAALTFEGLCK